MVATSMAGWQQCLSPSGVWGGLAVARGPCCSWENLLQLGVAQDSALTPGCEEDGTEASTCHDPSPCTAVLKASMRGKGGRSWRWPGWQAPNQHSHPNQPPQTLDAARLRPGQVRSARHHAALDGHVPVGWPWVRRVRHHVLHLDERECGWMDV
eukprot:364955-Chlamydomonas_euryale.AAC.28